MLEAGVWVPLLEHAPVTGTCVQAWMQTCACGPHGFVWTNVTFSPNLKPWRVRWDSLWQSLYEKNYREFPEDNSQSDNSCPLPWNDSSRTSPIQILKRTSSEIYQDMWKLSRLRLLKQGFSHDFRGRERMRINSSQFSFLLLPIFIGPAVVCR